MPLRVARPDPLEVFSKPQMWFGKCPQCDELFRFNEIRWSYGEPHRDWLDRFRERQQELDDKIDEADHREQEAALFKERLPRLVRQEASKRIEGSIRTRFGQTMQSLLPWIAPFHPDDFQWVGGVVDGIVWHGLHSGHVKRIVFVEEKAGAERLSSNQLEVQRAIEDRRVGFVTLSVPSELKRLMARKSRTLLD